MNDNYPGVLVIGHGMRDPSGTKAFFEIVEHVRQLLPQTLVEGAFLEFAQPTIAAGIALLVAQGAANIAVVPLFLSTTGHTTNDLPQAVAQAAGQYQEGSGFGSTELAEVRVQGSEVIKKHEMVKIRLKSHVGAHPRVMELSAVRFRQSLAGQQEIPLAKTLLVIAAHGSPEPEAIEELAKFAARTQHLTHVGRVEPCFVVLGKPQLADLPARLTLSSFQRIVVQSHLLLRGRYHDMICQQVETFRQEFPAIDWIATEPLGPDRLLAQAVAEILKG